MNFCLLVCFSTCCSSIFQKPLIHFRWFCWFKSFPDENESRKHQELLCSGIRESEAGGYRADGRRLAAGSCLLPVHMYSAKLLLKPLNPPFRGPKGAVWGRGAAEVAQHRETSATEGLNTESGVSKRGGEQRGPCSSVLSCLIHLSPFHPKVQKPRAPETNIVF